MTKDEKKKFKGFMLMARKEWEGESVGEWTSKNDNARLIDCFDLQNVWF